MAINLFLRRPFYSQLQKNGKLMSTLSSGTRRTDFVLAEEFGDVGVLILNRPKAMNALNVEMINKLFTTIDKWRNTKSMIIVKSNVDKVFSAGGDVAAVVQADTPECGKAIFSTGYALNYMISNLNIPYIALNNGVTIGGGVGISVYGKYRIATEKTVFAMPEATIGLFPDSGASYFFPRLQGKLGYYLGLTGSRLKSEDVFHAGIATHFCESGKIPELQKVLLTLKNTNDIDDAVNNFCPKPTTEFTLAKHLDQINNTFNGTSIMEIINNLKEDNSEWARKTINILQKISPTSLKVTLRALDLGSNQSLAECFQMEYRLANRLIQSSDFREGVRSLLIVKDKTPKWNPSRLEDVTDQHILSLFEPLPNNEDLSPNIALSTKM